MSKSKVEKKENNTVDLIVIVIGMLFVCLVAYVAGYNNGNTHCVKTCVDIPDYKMVREFCISKGFETGWLSDYSCGANAVMCNRDVGELTENKCIKWEKAKERESV